jgi:hypothetical protein
MTHKFLPFSLVLFLAFCFLPCIAKADYYVWADAKTGTLVSYPDDWKIINNQNPADIITLALPSKDATDKAQCKVRAEEDLRFQQFDNDARADIQRVYFSQDFWKQYLASFDRVNVTAYKDGTGLGQGFASMMVASYTTPISEAQQQRASLLSAAHYFNRVYLVDCSSSLQSYDRYAPLFESFLKTVQFNKAYHELLVGEYRDFLQRAGVIVVRDPNAVSTGVY